MYQQAGPQVPNLDSVESTANFMAAVASFNSRQGIKGLGQKKEPNSLDRILADQRAPADRTGLGYTPEPDASQQKASRNVLSIPYKTKDGWHVPPITQEALEESARVAMAPPQSHSHANDWGDSWSSAPANDWDDGWGSTPAVKIGNPTSFNDAQKRELHILTRLGPSNDSTGWDDVPAPSTSGGNWGTAVDLPSGSQPAQSKRYIAPHLRQRFVSAGSNLDKPVPATAASTSRQNISTRPVEHASISVSATAKPAPLPQTGAESSSREGLKVVPLKAENISPDLTTYKIPRANKDFQGSEHNPPTSVSTIDISDTGVQQLRDTRDARNCIALARDVFVDRHGKFYQTNWAKHLCHRDNDDEYFETENYLTSFVTAWVQDIPDDVKPGFLRDEVPEHWKSDVDTNTGLLVEPVHFPDTIIGDNSALTGEEDWRRRNWSSNLLIHRKFAELHRWKKKKGLKVEERRLAYKPGKVEQYVKPESRPADEVCDAMTPYDPGVPKIPAFLRPAEVVDMRAVSHIYEAEMKSGFQVVDSEPPTPEDWEKVLQTTRELSMPFIVAVYGSARRCGLKEGNLQWSDEPQVPYDEHEAASQGLVKGQILGFAYASVWQPGIAGSGQGTSRYTARLHVWVDPKHRRKKLGLCLLDKMLACMSPPHHARTGIDFIDIHNSPVYHKLQDDDVKGTPAEEMKKEEARRNRPRKYYNVQISYKFKHRPRWQVDNPTRYPGLKDHIKDLVWVKKLLEEKLPFIKLVTFEAVHQSSKLREPKEEDGNKKVFWLDEFVWEYYCTAGLPDSDDGF